MELFVRVEEIVMDPFYISSQAEELTEALITHFPFIIIVIIIVIPVRKGTVGQGVVRVWPALLLSRLLASHRHHKRSSQPRSCKWQLHEGTSGRKFVVLHELRSRWAQSLFSIS
jgi:hypothetical protein